MIISAVIDSIYNLADTFFVSGLGEAATAAVAINDSLMNVLRAIAMGFAACGGEVSICARDPKTLEETRAEIAKLGHHTLQVGMPAEVVLKTGERTFFGYLIKPLLTRLPFAFKER